mmetsp:Transcript_20910/g.44675  ORF Transcript_20910/g.44675 Transcript_20910/m.44675 type:complete len:144 (+) Transcript_20910:807-1238(+)|eukprot:CAMPEP_0206472098 /NCGR_PEP_ID=MMETSP0324_2-20121206/31981_1 /ASSEMBLY_ACC=CAM_ASM_000836 /TAXON_ID=2866 /ORGANISM="Crypthecodinium cohnii, Strain Seligo" /LENGTH=143 /DNA_ID=CAMNT_0053946599 /DNA_START=84 /DNA_END=515 /DNA_ORIENTATION=-
MGGIGVRSRKKLPRKSASRNSMVKKKDKARKKADKKKAAKDKKVNELADTLASKTTLEQGDDESSDEEVAADATPAPAPKVIAQAKADAAELRKKLRAKLAGQSLDRTAGIMKGKYDGAGLAKSGKGKEKIMRGRTGSAMDTS